MTELGLRTIPGYTVHERLEADLVSTTYLAERQSDGYPVLLQVISDEFDDVASADAFLDALDHMSPVRHPVVPEVWDAGYADGVLFAVTAAVEGRSLAATLAAQGRLPLDETLAVCSELADALDTLHAADVVHGAVNPYTVWINDRRRAPSAPRVTLRGFGASPLLAQRVAGERLDPPPPDVLYVAPEQLRREELSGRVDQYALACMVVHCLTGAPPFERATVNALVGAHLFAAPRSTEGRWDELTPHVVDAVQRAMAKDPADRFVLCNAFATAIGGDARRSWSWMIEEALNTRGEPVEIDLRGLEQTTSWEDEAGDGAETVPPPARERDRPDGLDNALRSLSAVDWLPGARTEADTDERLAPPPAPPRTPPRTRRGTPLNPQILRWIAVLCVTMLMVAAMLALLSRDSGQSVVRGEVREERAPPGPAAPVWQRALGSQPVTVMVATDVSVVGGSGAVLHLVDPVTGAPRWRAAVTGPVTELSAIGGVIVARTAGALHAFDEATGRALWDTSGEPGLPATVATGARELYEVADDAGDLLIRARAPRTGRVQWALDDLAAPGGATAAVYDPNRRGGQMLYVLNGSRLYAVDTAARTTRWQTDLVRPEPSSLTAIAGAILVISADGEICRHGMRDGSRVWSECATLERSSGSRAVARTRHGRVIVRSEREVAAVDFTSGTAHWRVSDEAGFQRPFATNTASAFMVHADGSVEAIDHQGGVERWRTAPLGDVSSMAATQDAVYVAAAGGRLMRFDADGAPAR